jgi:hypothetical protein
LEAAEEELVLLTFFIGFLTGATSMLALVGIRALIKGFR